MKTYVSLTSSIAALLLATGAFFPAAHAATVFSIAPTVTTVTHTATFSTITTGTNLSTYSENGIFVTVVDTNYSDFQPFLPGDSRASGFYYGTGGNNSFVSIRLTDGASFTALDFLLGDGYTFTNPTNLGWQAYDNGVLTGSGVVNGITGGTVVGWKDTAGFDELRVIAGAGDLSSFGNFQAIALDDLRIGGASNMSNVSAVPEPSGVLFLGCLLVGGLSFRSRRADI